MKRIVYCSLVALLFSITINPRPSGGGRSGGDGGSFVPDPSNIPTPTPTPKPTPIPISPQTQQSITDWINNNKAAFISASIGVAAAVGMVIDLLVAQFARESKSYKNAYTLKVGKKVLEFPRNTANAFNKDLKDANYSSSEAKDKTFKNKLKDAFVKTIGVSDDVVRYDKKESANDQRLQEKEEGRVAIENALQEMSIDDNNIQELRKLPEVKNPTKGFKNSTLYKDIMKRNANIKDIAKTHFTPDE